MNQPVQDEPQSNTLDEKDLSLTRDEGNENGMGAVKMAVSALVSFGLFSAVTEAGADFMDGFSINHEGIEVAGELNGTIANLEAPQPDFTPAPAPEVSMNLENPMVMAPPTPNMGMPS